MGGVPLYRSFANNIAGIGASTGILDDAALQGLQDSQEGFGVNPADDGLQAEPENPSIVGPPSRDIRYIDIRPPVITPLPDRLTGETGGSEQVGVSNEGVRIPEPLPPIAKRGRLQRFFDLLNGVSREDGRKLTEAQFRELLGARGHFGIAYDNKGHWLYRPDRKNVIISHLSSERVREHQWGILKLHVEGRIDPVLLFPGEIELKTEKGITSRLAFDDLVAPDLPEAARPIVFYLEGMDSRLTQRRRDTKPVTAQWIVALRNLGYPIIFTNSLQSFEATVRRHNPFIVLVSATQDLMPFAVKAYDVAKNIDPGIVVGLGGPGSIQEAGGLFDFVGIGEYYMALPRILRELIIMKNEGALKTGSSTPWREIIKRLTSDEELREKAIADLGERNNFSPIFDGGAAERLLETSARRYFSTESGDYSVEFPVAYDPIAGAKLFIRTDGGIVAPMAAGYDTSMVPPHILSPMLSDAEEFDKLSGAYYPSSADADTGSPFLFPAVYAQHGCKADPAGDRCNFCSITAPAGGGRSPSMDQLMKVMQTAVIFGQRAFTYVDDRFVQNKSWIREWAANVERLGLHKFLKIGIQTRVDGISDEIMDILRARLGLAFGIGIETTSPTRAESENGLRKVGRGRGEKYYADIRYTLERLAKKPVDDSDQFFIIVTSPGDRIVDVAEDVHNQLLIIEELWSKYGYFPNFSYSNAKQIPYYGDRVTSGLAGVERAQPGAILPGLSKGAVEVGSIIGRFLPFGVDIVGQGLMTFGMFMPKDFEWPEQLSDFIGAITNQKGMTLTSLLGASEPENVNIGDLVRALEDVHRNSKNLTPEERANLSVWLDKILPLYEQLKKRLGERVMSRKERQELKEKKMRSFGQIPGTTIM